MERMCIKAHTVCTRLLVFHSLGMRLGRMLLPLMCWVSSFLGPSLTLFISLTLFPPQEGLSAKGKEALDLTLSFDEKATIERNLNYLIRSLDVCTYILWFLTCTPHVVGTT